MIFSLFLFPYFNILFDAALSCHYALDTMDPAYSNSLRSAEWTLGIGEQSGRFQGNHDYAGDSSTCTGSAGFHCIVSPRISPPTFSGAGLSGSSWRT